MPRRPAASSTTTRSGPPGTRCSPNPGHLHALQAGVPHPARDERCHAQGARRHPGPVLPRPGRDLRLCGGGAAVPPRRRPSCAVGPRVAGHPVRGHPAGPPRSSPSSTTSTRARGRCRVRSTRESSRGASSRAPSTTTGPSWASGRATECAFTSRPSTSSVTEEGTFRVLEDNVRVPSGGQLRHREPAGHGQRLSEAFARMRIRPVHDYPRMLLSALH